MAVRKVRNDSAAAATIANTAVAANNTTNIADLPTKVNQIIAALVALGFVKNS